MSQPSLNGYRITITGAARGIGFATASALAARGANIVIGDLDQGAASAAAAAIGPAAQGLHVDISDQASFNAFHAAATTAGPIDVLINNAGIMPIGRFLDSPVDVYRRAVEINVLGCIYGMHTFLPNMLERGQGHIVNIASTAGKSPVPGGIVYCGTKSAVVALTEAARVEYASSGISFTCVMPHFTNTELITGTTPTRLVPLVQPSGVAHAIVSAITDRKSDVFVPKMMGPLLKTQPLLGRRIRDLVNRKLGAYNTFLDFDTEPRANYNRRIMER